MRARQAEMHVCCQAFAWHRFDCTAAPREQRGAGPFLRLRRHRVTDATG